MNYMDEHMDGLVNGIRAKILHILEVFPFLSASQLHISIGSSITIHLWRPALEQMIKEGLIAETTVPLKTPLGRAAIYHIYHLTSNPYTYQPSMPSAQPQSSSLTPAS